MRLEAAQRFIRHMFAARSPLPALLVALISVACGRATADPLATTPVSLVITVPPATSQGLPRSDGSYKSFASIPSLLALVKSVSLSVIDANNQPVMGATAVSISAGQTVPVTLEVLTGPGRIFVGRAMDEPGTVLFQGQSSPVNLDGSPVSVQITMTLNPFPLDLTVTLSDTGSGTVTSNPPGIAACGASCSALFSRGTDVTLTAVPDSTSTFIGWAGTVCTGTGPCTVTMTAAQTVTARFTRSRYLLEVTKIGTGGGTVSSDPSGINCGAACAAHFDAASTVTLTAAPDAASSFTGWTGATCAGTGPCTVTMDASKSVTATFTLVPKPTITRLSLTHGVIGDTLKIRGAGFGATQGTVTVGGLDASPLAGRWNDMEIAVTIPAVQVISGNLHEVLVTANGQQSNKASITLLDRVLGVGGATGDRNLDRFVLQVGSNATTQVMDVGPTDLGSSSAVAVSADGTTAGEADGANSVASAVGGTSSERIIGFHTDAPTVDPLQTSFPNSPSVFGQDIAVSRDGSVALIAGGQVVTLGPELILITNFGSLSPSLTTMPLPGDPLNPQCVHEVALSADGNTAAVITGGNDGCAGVYSPVKIFRVDHVVTSPQYTEVVDFDATTGGLPGRFTDLAISEDGATLVAGIIVNQPTGETTAGILRVTNFSAAPVPLSDMVSLTKYSAPCQPTTVDVDLSADGITAIVGMVNGLTKSCVSTNTHHVFQLANVDAPAATSFELTAPPNLEGVTINSGGSIALVRVNGFTTVEPLLTRYDGFNLRLSSPPVPAVETNLQPVTNLNTTIPLRPQDQIDLQ